MKKLIDPFRYFSGGRTFAVGVAGMLMISLLARWSGTTFRGVVSQGLGDLAFWQLLLQQIAGWGVFSLLLYGAGLFFSRSKIRALDVFGNQALARVPLLLILLGGMFSPIRQMTEAMLTTTPQEALENMDLVGLTIFGCFSLAVLVWFFWWSYRGFAVAANLRGGKAAAIYIVCYLLAEAGAGWCTHAIVMW